MILFAQHSSWGGASNFNEMFNFSGKYKAYEILESHGGPNGYDFGASMLEHKKLYSRRTEIKELISGSDTIFFIFDLNGLNLFLKCMSELGEKIQNRLINIFWSGHPYIYNSQSCNGWVEKNGAKSYAMLDLIKYNNKSLPLMQPYDTARLSDLKSSCVRKDDDFIICHSPGHKGKSNEKGTQIIQKVISDLKKKYKRISYKQLGDSSWLTHKECLSEKAACDVFIDKVGLHSAGGIGKSGIEGICLGIPTLSAIHKSNFVGHYKDAEILSSNTEEELRNHLIELIENTEYYNLVTEKMWKTASLFDYDTTLSYLEKTMHQ